MIDPSQAEALAGRYGTPLLAIDLDVLDARLDAVLGAASAANVGVCYAGKALLLVALARYLAPRPIGIDVCSLGELLTAERAGIGPHRLTFHGAGKTDEELQAVRDGRAGRIGIDNLTELERLLARDAREPFEVLLRLNTGIEAHTHDYVRTAGDDSKFGLAPHELNTALDLLRSAKQARLRGVHGHIGSQIYSGAPFAENVTLLLEALRRAREAGFDADTIVAGGGFGVTTHPEQNDEAFDLPAALTEMRARAGDNVRLEIEPGRSLVATAGTSFYRVVAIKRYDTRTFAIVDGSISDNPRPALYGAYHHVTAVRGSSEPHAPYTICGRSCENDELARTELPQDLAPADLIAMETTGAYTYSMASNYNRFPRPAVVAVRGTSSTLWARRETLEDLLRNDVL